MKAQDWYEITQLLHRYAQVHDGLRKDAIGDCFTIDAVFDGLANPHSSSAATPARGRATGRAEIVEALSGHYERASLTVRLHQVTDTLVLEEQDDRVRLTSSVVVLERPTDGLVYYIRFVGAYDDIVVRDTDGRWRISSRVLRQDSAGLTSEMNVPP